MRKFNFIVYIVIIITFITVTFNGVSIFPIGIGVLPASGASVISMAKDVSYGADPQQKLDVWYDKNFSNAPVIVLVHGGGWMSGDKKDMYASYADFFHTLGYVVVAPNYRLTIVGGKNTFPIPINDVACSVAWTKKNISRYNANPSNVFILGHSAGSQIAAMLAVNQERNWLEGCGIQDQNLKFKGFIGSSGVYDFNLVKKERWQAGCFLRDLLRLGACDEGDVAWAKKSSAQLNLASPAAFVSAGDPPGLLLAGAKDCFINNPEHGKANYCVANNTRMKDALTRAGVYNKLVIIPGYNHGDVQNKFKVNSKLQNAVKDFLKLSSATTAPSAALTLLGPPLASLNSKLDQAMAINQSSSPAQTPLPSLVPPSTSRVDSNFHGILFDDHGKTSASLYGEHPLLSGVMMRTAWVDINPQEKVFNFTEPDDKIAEWAEYGKVVYLGIVPMSQGKAATPEWLYQKGVEKICYTRKNELTCVPKIWDEVVGGIDPEYMKYYSAAVHEFAKHYENDPRVNAVMIGVGLLGYMNADPNAEGTSAFYAQHWTPEAYKNSVRSIVDLYKREFPNKPLVIHPTAVLLRDKNPPVPYTPYYQDVIEELTREFAKQGISIFGIGLDEDQTVYQETIFPQLFGDLSDLAFSGNHQQGIGDDWPFFSSAGPDSRDEADFDRVMKFAIGGVGGIPRSNISFIKFLEPELTATFPGKPEFNQKVYDSTQWMLSRLIQYPDANFSHRAEGLDVTFDASESLDADSNPVANYTWDFGDGTIVPQTRAMITHTYKNSGSYNVILTITDSKGIKNKTGSLLNIESVSESFDYDNKDSERDISKTRELFQYLQRLFNALKRSIGYMLMLRD